MDLSELTGILPLELVKKIMYTHGGLIHPCAILIKNIHPCAIMIKNRVNERHKPLEPYGDTMKIHYMDHKNQCFGKLKFFKEDFPFMMPGFFNLRNINWDYPWFEKYKGQIANHLLFAFPNRSF